MCRRKPPLNSNSIDQDINITMQTLLLAAALFISLALPAEGASTPGCAEPQPIDQALYQTLRHAQDALTNNQPQQATQAIDAYLQSHPNTNHHQLAFFRGLAHYQRHQLPQAQRYFKRSSQLHPCFAPAWQYLATVEFKRGRFAETLQTISQAIKWLTPLPAALIVLQASAQVQTNQRRAAARALKQLPVEDANLAADIIYQAALIWLDIGRPKQALPLLRRLNRRANPCASWRAAMINTYIKLNQPNQAEPLIQKQLDRSPTDVKLWHMLAWAAAAQKKHGDAAAALSIAYQFEPPDAEGWRQLANLYRLAGIPKKAVNAYRHAFGAKPSAADLDLLTDTYILARDMDHALLTARRAAKLSPTARRWEKVGDISLRQQRFQDSLTAFQLAASLSDSSGKIYLKAGYAAWRLDMLNEAENELKKALQRARPNSLTARQAVQALALLQERKNVFKD